MKANEPFLNKTTHFKKKVYFLVCFDTILKIIIIVRLKIIRYSQMDILLVSFLNIVPGTGAFSKYYIMTAIRRGCK